MFGSYRFGLIDGKLARLYIRTTYTVSSTLINIHDRTGTGLLFSNTLGEIMPNISWTNPNWACSV